jgi:alkanesulfonate monooxygenase SsuD/methylene tetrahydromethanopterin reductase-like flavin-dependent oxidoreductase (luciferase family)
MRIGMSLTTSYPGHNDSRMLIKNLMARVELMAELGFDSLSLGDHHLTRDHYFQVLPTMSRLSAHAGEMHLIPLFLLPFYNPILLAEQLATLDVISDGRITVICCLGYQPEVHDAFQVPQTSRVSRFVEAFEIMQRLWTEDMVTFQGKHYVFKDVSINPKPVQQPLPMWIGAGADPAIRRTARLADAWVISPGWTPGFIEEKLQLYRTALQECGRSTQVTDVILRRDLHLAATADIARREAQALFERGYRGFDRQAMAESLIVSGPEECIRYLESMQRLGITHVLFRCAVQDQSKALQTIRLIGTEVIPHFRASSAQG